MRSCVIEKASDDSIGINCDPGYDGGLEQIFHLEVYQTESNTDEHLTLVSNVTNNYPSFSINNLQRTSNFLLFHVYSSNLKGRSFESIRLKYRSPETKSSNSLSGDQHFYFINLLRLNHSLFEYVIKPVNEDFSISPKIWST